MSDQRIIFSPEHNQWTLADGQHHMEVPEWAREIMRSEFERETRPLQAEADMLREENERFIIKLNAEHIMRQNVEADNAKLRKLAHNLLNAWDDIQHEVITGPTFDECEQYAYELGVEVDG